jgi:DNA topoisomerase IB
VASRVEKRAPAGAGGHKRAAAANGRSGTGRNERVPLAAGRNGRHPAVAEADERALLQADLAGPGLRRRRSGRGFRYLTADGTPLRDAAALARIKALVIPPAWEDVWICPDPRGHIQALGTDAAGRRQYLYHHRWREQRDEQKFDRVMEFGRALPRVRSVVERHLQGQGLTRDRVLATAVRLIDLGFFRSGSDEYATENGTFGLATIRREHVTCGKCELTFEYTGKSGKHREQAVADETVCSVVRSLKRRRAGREWEDLLVYRSGPRWHNVTAADINDYLREVAAGDFTAKDFRTWHATVLAAVGLAVSEGAAAESPAARKRAIATPTARPEPPLVAGAPGTGRRCAVRRPVGPAGARRRAGPR